MLSGSTSATSLRPAAGRRDHWRIARAIADSLLAVLIAPTCAACGVPLEHPTRGAVCARCWNGIVRFTPPLCRQCGDPLPTWRVASVAAALCARCGRHEPVVSTARAVGSYEGPLRAVLHALKYGKRQSLARPLALLMATACAEILAGIDLAVPGPLHRRRRRARGFNQAEELARHLGVPWTSALRRTRATDSQTDLPAAQRYANVRNAFALRRRQRVDGFTLLLVDDVSTTGATLEACARVLRLAGAREVRALTAARVVSTRP